MAAQSAAEQFSSSSRNAAGDVLPARRSQQGLEVPNVHAQRLWSFDFVQAIVLAHKSVGAYSMAESVQCAGLGHEEENHRGASQYAVRGHP